MTTASLSKALAAHVVRTSYCDIPAPAIAAAKHSLLDAIGVMLGASTLGDGARAFADLARAAGGPGQSTVLGFGFKAPLAAAALANGAMAHALDFEDAYDAAPLHPNASAIPAAIAFAEAMGAIPGERFLAALAIGCDVAIRLARALTANPDAFGFYAPPVLGAYGATAAIAKLADLDEAQVLDAFSLTLCQATSSAEVKSSPHSVIRAVRDAFPAQAAVLSVQLAARGIKGFDAPFEGKAGFFETFARGAYDPVAVVADLGAKFHGEDVSFKYWPSCRGTHAFVEAALMQRGEAAWAAGEVERIILTGHPLFRMLIEPDAQRRRPKTAIDAKFSLPFTVAAALVHGEITLDSFSPAALADQRIHALADKVVYREAPDCETVFGAMETVLAGGRVISNTVAYAYGHPRNPLGAGALAQKFRACARHAARPIADEQVEGVIKNILALEQCADVGQALAALAV